MILFKCASRLKENFTNLFLFSISLIFIFGCSPAKISVNASTSKALTEQPPVVTPEPPSPIALVFGKQIRDVASKSTCAQNSWTDRGQAPMGYIKGMALSYARSLCRVKASGSTYPAAVILRSPNSLDAKKDVLMHYQDLLANIGLVTAPAGQQPVHATYVIGLGLGMKESSGKYCEGWDVAAGANRESDEAEAGLFQASYNSVIASAELQRLYDEYRGNTKRCLLEVYKEGVTCRPASILGTGAGADFQEFAKRCPAFTTEYAMTLIRILRTHFGPLNRRTAEVEPTCDTMLSMVRQIINQNPEAACRELL